MLERNKRVSVIIIVDSRKELPSSEAAAKGATVSYYSLLGLPLRRNFVRKVLAQNAWQESGEIIYEMGNAEHESAGLARLIEALVQQEANGVYVDDSKILKETYIANSLLSEMILKGFVVVSS